MSVSSRKPVGQAAPAGTARLTARAVAFAILWAVLTDGEGWGIGLPVVIIATAASRRVSPAVHLSFTGLLLFLPYFFWNSLRGGFDVAVRAVHPRLPIKPALTRYALRLDSPAARVVMANTVTLLPGTLSAELEGDTLRVHVLYEPDGITTRLETLERRVANLFGENLEAGTI